MSFASHQVSHRLVAVGFHLKLQSGNSNGVPTVPVSIAKATN
ncbi:hypothetical protein SV7mr_11760 [Stieleria bergensis]|uniref:Uncharacterized protein n=1 Tax=Stieleria bergensis TaxID=2528025 RepID=A0A517SRF8_9BACT|nr:hypothetical protein SV7mr_11760 [Planctomycetes bacterium SV_7m_r]